jgi:hypothetical protein
MSRISYIKAENNAVYKNILVSRPTKGEAVRVYQERL